MPVVERGPEAPREHLMSKLLFILGDAREKCEQDAVEGV